MSFETGPGVLDLILRHGRDRPAAPALETLPGGSGTRGLSYGELAGKVVASARELRRTGEPGQVIVLALPNGPDLVVWLLATLLADMVVFPVPPGLPDPELNGAAGRAGARRLVRCDEGLAAIAPADLRGHQDLACSTLAHAALYLQSSGTTGAPKIVRRPLRTLDAVAHNVAEATDLRPADRVLAVIPQGHSYGIENALLAPLAAGATLAIGRGFEPAAVMGALAGSVTVFPGVPFMFQMLGELAGLAGHARHAGSVAGLPSLRLAYSAGSVLPAPVVETCAARLGFTLGQLYGSTEVGSITFNDPARVDFDPQSVGRPMRGVEIRVVPSEATTPATALPTGVEGHVAVRAPSMLESYVDTPEAATVGGYFMMGDLGRCSEAGDLTITGRLKSQIDVGGQKVNPAEVERVLAMHPAVRECVVTTLPVSATLNRLRAVVVLEPHGPETGVEPLRIFVRGHLSAYKVPRVIEFRAALPRTASGKIDRVALSSAS